MGLVVGAPKSRYARRDIPDNHADRVLALACSEGGVEWAGSHTFRHTVASRLFAAGRNPEHTQKFCTEMSAKLGIPVEPAADIAGAVRESQVVTTMTSASDPLLFGSMLAPGTHVNAAGSNRATSAEIDPEVVRRAGIVALEDLAQAKVESGDLLLAERNGAWDWSRSVPLSDIVTGKVPGRTSDDQITLFESLGIALWDIAAANHIYDACVKRGLGRDVDLPL